MEDDDKLRGIKKFIKTAVSNGILKFESIKFWNLTNSYGSKKQLIGFHRFYSKIPLKFKFKTIQFLFQRICMVLNSYKIQIYDFR